MNKSALEDKRLLEALDYIDERFIAEVTDDYEIFDVPGEYTPNKRRVRKAYAVALMRAACVLLFIGIVAALPTLIDTARQAGMYGNYTLTQEDLNYINLVFLEHGGSKFAESLEEANANESFYGKYGDCFIFRGSGEQNMAYHVVVGDYLFTHSSRPAYKVIYDGDMYDLFAAYELGYLNDTDVKMLNEYLYGDIENDVERYVPEENYIMSQSMPIELPFNEISDIIHSYFRLNLSLSPSFTSNANNIYYVRCFGEYDGAYAVMIDRIGYAGTYKQESTQTAYQYTFDQQHMGVMFVYENGTLQTLSDAASSGVLNESEVGSLHAYYNEVKDQYTIYHCDDLYSAQKYGMTEEIYLRSFLPENSLYLGKYGDCYASYININNVLSGGTHLIVAGYDFGICPVGSSIECFYGTEHYNIGEAYAKGYASEEDIKNIHAFMTKIYGKCRVSKDTSPVEIPAANAARAVYAHLSGNISADFEHSISCYKTEDGVFAFIYHPQGVLSAMSTEEVNGYVFVYTNSSEYMEIFADGKVYRLSEAFDKGIIDASFLLLVYREYCNSLNFDVEAYIKELKSGGRIYFSDDEKTEIHNAYEKEFGESAQRTTLLWENRQKYAVIITPGSVQLPGIVPHFIGDYIFCYTASDRMMIYTEGKLYDPETAYESGIIDEEYMKAFHAYYSTNYYAELHEKNKQLAEEYTEGN